ncbi:MAG: hypothetical protein QOH68_785 [Nocardioidaceae bacterium]|nr:hypothetical protein [Nocardioidaceae bacterium]
MTTRPEPDAVAPGWQLLLDRLAAETEPTLRRNLEVVARHVVEEVAGRREELMATLVPEPGYTVWGASESNGPTGRAEVHAWYDALGRAGRNRLDYVLERVVVDSGAVVTEGDFFYAIAGRDLPGATFTEAGDSVAADTFYLVGHRALVMWPVDDAGLIEGEHIYAGERHRVIRPLAGDELTRLGPPERAS